MPNSLTAYLASRGLPEDMRDDMRVVLMDVIDGTKLRAIYTKTRIPTITLAEVFEAGRMAERAERAQEEARRKDLAGRTSTSDLMHGDERKPPPPHPETPMAEPDELIQELLSAYQQGWNALHRDCVIAVARIMVERCAAVADNYGYMDGDHPSGGIAAAIRALLPEETA